MGRGYIRKCQKGADGNVLVGQASRASVSLDGPPMTLDSIGSERKPKRCYDDQQAYPPRARMVQLRTKRRGGPGQDQANKQCRKSPPSEPGRYRGNRVRRNFGRPCPLPLPRVLQHCAFISTRRAKPSRLSATATWSTDVPARSRATTTPVTGGRWTEEEVKFVKKWALNGCRVCRRNAAVVLAARDQQPYRLCQPDSHCHPGRKPCRSEDPSRKSRSRMPAGGIRASRSRSGVRGSLRPACRVGGLAGDVTGGEP